MHPEWTLSDLWCPLYSLGTKVVLELLELLLELQNPIGLVHPTSSRISQEKVSEGGNRVIAKSVYAAKVKPWEGWSEIHLRVKKGSRWLLILISSVSICLVTIKYLWRGRLFNDVFIGYWGFLLKENNRMKIRIEIFELK